MVICDLCSVRLGMAKVGCGTFNFVLHLAILIG